MPQGVVQLPPQSRRLAPGLCDVSKHTPSSVSADAWEVSVTCSLTESELFSVHAGIESPDS